MAKVILTVFLSSPRENVLTHNRCNLSTHVLAVILLFLQCSLVSHARNDLLARTLPFLKCQPSPACHHPALGLLPLLLSLQLPSPVNAVAKLVAKKKLKDVSVDQVNSLLIQVLMPLVQLGYSLINFNGRFLFRPTLPYTIIHFSITTVPFKGWKL